MVRSDTSPQPSLIDALGPFRNQNHLIHLSAVILGVLIWTGTYIGIMILSGWGTLANVDTHAAVAARRNAAATASLLCGLYFGFLWYQGIGGPILNFLYPAAIIVLIPDQVYALFQSPPAHTITMAEYSEYRIQSFRWYIDYLIIAGPSFLGVLLAIKFWGEKMLNEKDKQEFMDTHLPPVWRN